jgi:hypothetical protein
MTHGTMGQSLKTRIDAPGGLTAGPMSKTTRRLLDVCEGRGEAGLVGCDEGIASLSGYLRCRGEERGVYRNHL